MSWAFPTVDKPEGFSKSEAASWETGEQTGLGKDVNVIMVMNEAFSDLTDSPAFDYGEEDDPLSNLHALEADPHALSGHLVVPGFAGGTANTEFDVLTGIQTNALSASTTSSFRVVNRNLESLFRVFDADGYATSFFHPGDDWFYNRENVYRWLGAERTLFADEMEAVEYKGRWVTDDYMSDLITNELDSAVSAGELLFHYTTTIQNHMSYTADKYGEGYEFPPVPLTISVSDEVETMLRVYAEGVRDADAMLGRLVDTFSAQEEPVVLVYFGDHLPYLGDNQLGYQALGLTQEADWDALRSYETPYVIWANSAAKETLGRDFVGDGGDFSPCFLMTELFDQCGWTGPGFMELSRQVRAVTPLVHTQGLYLVDGQLTDILAPEDQALLDQFLSAEYFRENQLLPVE